VVADVAGSAEVISAEFVCAEFGSAEVEDDILLD
jgi:hypothetical protein